MQQMPLFDLLVEEVFFEYEHRADPEAKGSRRRVCSGADVNCVDTGGCAPHLDKEIKQ